jgi:hypothetical protein
MAGFVAVFPCNRNTFDLVDHVGIGEIIPGIFDKNSKYVEVKIEGKKYYIMKKYLKSFEKLKNRQKCSKMLRNTRSA